VTADRQRLQELARDAGRELALERDEEARRQLLTGFVMALAAELVAALQHRQAA
jgi:hypothetical protein